jgi:release factor glutamine methyltransferase
MNTANEYSVEFAARLISGINGHDPVAEAQELFDYATNEDHYRSILAERMNHTPTAYITNHCIFRDLDLYIDERVLVPRTETEPLVQIAVEEIPQGGKVIDVGTGSGSVALAVKNERPDLFVMGTDISKDAVDVATINSSALDLDVVWDQADLIDGVKGEFDAVLANMPYLPTVKRDSYEPEMVDHEPEIALWGGLSGYDLITRLLSLVSARKGVRLVGLEIGLGQQDDVCELVREAGFNTVFCTTDKKENIRCVVGKRV